MWDRLKFYLIGMSSSIVFGIIDNGVMILGGDAIDGYITESLGLDTMTSAGLGNTLSDAVGVLCGGAVLAFLSENLGAPSAPSTMQQFVGITIGCLIPVALRIIFQLT